MKILIYMPFADWIPHLATDLEIAAKHINNGDDVHIIQCSGGLASCEPNPNHYSLRCSLCRSKRNKGLDLIKLPEENRHELALHKFDQFFEIPDFPSIQELKEFQINNVDIGMAVTSTLISMVREPYPDIKHYKHFINKNLPMSLAVYNAIEYYLEEIKPDVFYLFNGRYAALRPAQRAAQKLGVKTYVHERAGVLQRYSLTEDTYPHDIEYQKSQIEQHWNDERPIAKKEELARQWFEERRGGKDQSWHSFTKSQVKGNLPKDFDPTRRNIAIFISSQDEFESIAGWENPIYKDQIDAINSIINGDADENIRFYLRIHPNLKGLKNTQTKELSGLEAPNLTVIPADASIDSYELMDACEKVITFGSTMGIESVFWGKPSILVGRALYENVEGCYIPETHDELIDQINLNLTTKPNTGALKYGYKQAIYGYPYKYYSPESVRGGKFMGVYLTNPIITQIKAKILSVDLFSKLIFNFAYSIRKLTWKIRRM
ncbi:MAG: Capsule polysaccharide biosynthesis protein [Candidatus Methanocomedens sp.]|nr:MAG: Capsule polysaccharide biosynthesis protein [ANME-2 cluster archaeon]